MPEISTQTLADLSDRLTYAIRENDQAIAAAVRDRLDDLAGREPWRSTDQPRPPLDYTPYED